MHQKEEVELGSQTLWDDFTSLFPEDTAQIAAELGIMKGARQDKDLFNAMRVLLMHLSSGLSLKETAVRGKIAGICSMSAVALHHRLIKFGPLFKMMCQKILDQSYRMTSANKLKLIDATDICEPGPTGSSYRIHTAFSLPGLCIDTMKLTPVRGKGNGESFCHFAAREGDIFIADRGYCRADGIKYIVANKADVMVRYYGALPLYLKTGRRFDLLKALIPLKETGDNAQWECYIKPSGNTEMIKGRVCAIRKSEAAIVEAHRRCKDKSRKNCRETRESTLFINEYIIIFTTLPCAKYPLKKVLDLYRWKWQIELVFKRLKSLLELGCLPKTTGDSALAWLYGKMLLALLIEKISIQRCAFSPWRQYGTEDDIQGIIMENL